jgi:hypothetical protein
MAPKSTDKGKAKEKYQSEKSDYNCVNIRRISEFFPDKTCPSWHSRTNYGVFDVTAPDSTNTDRGKRSRKLDWESSGNPRGVYLPVALNATLGDATLVASYNNFQSESDYISFVDGPCEFTSS